MCSQLQNFYTISTPPDIIRFNRKSPNLNKNHQFWPQKHQIQPKFFKFNQNSSNLTKNHLIHKIENYIEKGHLMNNKEVGINLH